MSLRHARAFSLLEVIIVIALVVTLGALALSAYGSMTQAAALTTATQRLQDALNDARQDALTRNLPVEIRFYAEAGTYRMLQARELNASGPPKPISPPVILPAGIVIDPTATHSPLIAANNETATADATDPLLNGQTRVFRFLPDGSTDLASGNSWFATLRAASASDPAHFPANWASVTIDPATGRLQTYSP